MNNKKPIPKWYVLSTFVVFVVIFIADILSKFVTSGEASALFFVRLIFFTVFVDLYAVFQLIFIILTYRKVDFKVSLLGLFAFLSLIIPVLAAFLSDNFENNIFRLTLLYVFPIITIFFAVYLLKRRFSDGSGKAHISAR